MQSLEDIKAEAAAAIDAAADIASLEELRVSYLGKKGALTGLLKGLGQLSAEERPKAGAEINAVKQVLNEQLNSRRDALQSEALSAQLATEAIDVTLPGRRAGGKREGSASGQKQFDGDFHGVISLRMRPTS